eukprot:403357777
MIFTVPSDITLPSIGAISCTGVTGFKKTPTCAVTTSTTIKVSFSTGTINQSNFPLFVITQHKESRFSNDLEQPQSRNIQQHDASRHNLLSNCNVHPHNFGIKRWQHIHSEHTSWNLHFLQHISEDWHCSDSIKQSDYYFPEVGAEIAGEEHTTEHGGDLSGTTSCSSLVSAASSGIVDTVTVTGLFATTIGLAIGKTIKITITNVRNPPTLKPYSTYEIATTDTNLNVIEQCSGLSLTMTSVGQLSSDSLVRVINTVEINALGTYLFIIKITNPLPVGGWIRVILPSEVTASTTPSYTTLVPALSSSPTVTMSGTQIDIKNLVSNYINADEAVSFTLSNIKNPGSIKPTSSFSVYTFDESNFGIDSRTTTLTATATAGALSSVIVKPINITGVLQYAKNYSVWFTINNPLAISTDGVTITFDSTSLGYQVSSRTCLIFNANSAMTLKAVYTCKADQTTNTITIGGILNSAVAKKQFFNFTIGNLYIRNPPTSKASPAITVQTTQGGYSVDLGSATQINHNYTHIATALVSADSYQTNKEDVSYTFTINVPGYVLTTSWLVITLPSQITFYDESKAERQCGRLTLVGFQNSSRLDCKVDGQNITIKKGFDKAITDDPVTLQINIPGLRNPRSLAATSGFNISIVDASQYYPVYISYNSPTISMTSVSKMKSVVLVRSSKVNGDSANYTFTVNVANNIASIDYFIVTLPDDGPLFNSKSKCIGQGSYFNTRTMTYTYQSPYSIKFTIVNKSLLRNLQTSISSSFSVLVTDVKNPTSTKPSSSLTISQYTSTGSQVESVNTGVLVVNDSPAQFNTTQFSVTLANYQVSASTSYTFTFNPVNYQQDMIVHIVFPSEVVLPSAADAKNVKCDAVQGTSYDLTCTLNVTNRTLIVKNAFPFPLEPRVISFAVSPITNPPQIIKTSTFKISTYSSEYYALDARNTSLLLDFACQLPCRSCVVTNITGCSSCYSSLTGNASLTNLPFLVDRYCYELCPVSTYQDFSTYTCPSCYSKRCRSCTGPKSRQCTSCLDKAVLINGNCVLYMNADYPMPFFIASVCWIALVFIFLISCGNNKTWFIPSCIAGVSILEWIHMFLQVGIYDYYGFTDNSYITVIGGISLNCLLNIYFLALYLTRFRNHQALKEHRIHFKKVQISNVIASSFMSSRIFKFLYSHLNDKESCQIKEIVRDEKLKIYYSSQHYFSMLPTAFILANSVYNLMLSVDLDLKFTILMDIEIVLMSGIILSLMAIEFVPRCKDRPQWIQKIIHNNEQQKIKYVTEKYNELGNTSMISQYDGENDKSLKLHVMRGLLTNLRQIKPNNLEQKVQELIDKEQGIFSSQDIQLQRRKSDPAPFSKDNKKSHHFQNFKMQNSTMKNDINNELGLLGGGNNFKDMIEDDDEGDRNLMSFPLTPTRAKKYQLADKNQGRDRFGSQDFMRDQAEHTFRQAREVFEKQAEKIVVDKRDQEVHMSQDFAMRNQWEKLEKEKAEIQKLNEDLKEQRLQLERERAEIERLRDEGSKSARGMRHDKDQLEGIDQQEYMSQTARQEKRVSNFKQTNLDAVRETDKEDKVKDKRSQSTLSNIKSRNNSLTKRSRNQTLNDKRNSTKSFNSDLNPPNPHRCHGQSDKTREAVYKLRQKEGPSRSSSIADFNSPSRNNLQNVMSQKSQVALNNKRDSTKNVKEMTKKNGTKIYYSDKSESSIEDLMDETPTTYNLANGRLDGKSMGYRFGKNVLSKGNSPDKIDIFNEQQRRLNEIGSESNLSKKQSPRIKKKKFRQDMDSNDEEEKSFTNNNSTSIFNLEGSNAGNEDISFIPQNKRVKKLNRDLSKYNNISNIINDPMDPHLVVNDNQVRAQSMLEMTSTPDYPSRNHQLSTQTQNITGLIYGNAKMAKSREMSTSNKGDTRTSGFNQSKGFSKERIKALEVAYLTKLVPNKSPQRGSTTSLINGALTANGFQQNPVGGTQRINAAGGGRINNHTPDVTSKITGMQILNPPQINNFQ